MAILVIILILVLVGTIWFARLAVRGVEQLIARVPPDPLGFPTDYGLAFTEVWFTTQDRLRLHGWFIPASVPTSRDFGGLRPARGISAPTAKDKDWGPPGKGTVIFCHGRFGSKDPDLEYVPWFHEAGYHVFMFDFRGHGRSEGDYCSYGCHERKDLQAAISLLASKGQGPIGVLGFSMGAAVAIATAAQSPEIACVVSDGVYARLRKVIVSGSDERGYPHWLAGLLFPLVLWLAGRRVGGNLEEADPLLWVAALSPRPLFLIHGGWDKFTAMEDVERLFAAAGEPKELWVVPEAEHRRVDDVRREEYKGRLLRFFDRYLAAQAVKVPEGIEEA